MSLMIALSKNRTITVARLAAGTDYQMTSNDSVLTVARLAAGSD